MSGRVFGPLRNARVLVAGGAGFIGSHTVASLMDREAHVLNLDALSYASAAGAGRYHASNHYQFVHGDIGDRNAVLGLLRSFNPDIVLNLAAETHVDRSIDDAQPFVYANVVALTSLLQACVQYWREDKPRRFRFVQMSTDEVFGSIDVGEFTEESRFAPNSPYAATKASGDHLVAAFHATYNLPIMTLRSTNAYGPRQYPEKFIPHMISAALRGVPMPLYGDGSNVRDWLYVEDLAHGIALALEKGGVTETYNFAAKNERTNREVLEMLCERLDVLLPLNAPHARLIEFVQDRPGHDKRYAVSPEKVKRELGWCSRTTFEAGLTLTVKWYLENLEWRQRILAAGFSPHRIGLPG